MLLFNPHISSAREALSLSSFYKQESKDTKRFRNLSLASGSAPLWSQRLPVPDPVSLPEPAKLRRPPPFLPCPAQGRLHREPLGGRGAGAGGVGVTSLPISDDREKQGEPVTGAEARRGADGPPSEPRLDRGRRGEGGVAEQAALTGEAEAGGARCESRAS